MGIPVKILGTLLIAASIGSGEQQPTPEAARKLAAEGYIYGYPLVLMHATADSALRNRDRNELRHARTFPNAKYRHVARPNVDTLYSDAWLDLSKEPVILSC